MLQCLAGFRKSTFLYNEQRDTQFIERLLKVTGRLFHQIRSAISQIMLVPLLFRHKIDGQRCFIVVAAAVHQRRIVEHT